MEQALWNPARAPLAERKALSPGLLLSTILVAASCAAISNAAVIKVGGDSGWTFAVLNTWQAPIVHVGDQLQFYYSPTLGIIHDVWQLPDQAAFDACDFSGAKFLGNATYTTAPLLAPGQYFYACGVASGLHCRLNQKVFITVEPVAVGGLGTP